jgi:hypothetical protein
MTGQLPMDCCLPSQCTLASTVNALYYTLVGYVVTELKGIYYILVVTAYCLLKGKNGPAGLASLIAAAVHEGLRAMHACAGCLLIMQPAPTLQPDPPCAHPACCIMLQVVMVYGLSPAVECVQ